MQSALERNPGDKGLWIGLLSAQRMAAREQAEIERDAMPEEKLDLILDMLFAIGDQLAVIEERMPVQPLTVMSHYNHAGDIPYSYSHQCATASQFRNTMADFRKRRGEGQ